MSGAERTAAKALLPKTGEIAQQAFNGTSAALDVDSSALGAAGLNRILRLVATEDCYIACGPSTVTVAANTGVLLSAGIPLEGWLPPASTHIAVIEAATDVGGTLIVSLASPRG